MVANSNGSLAAVAEMIHWVGILFALALVGLNRNVLPRRGLRISRFKVSKPIQHRVLVIRVSMRCLRQCFVCSLSTDLRNEGLKGYAATCVAVTILLWLGCAMCTVWKSVIMGQLFYAPGLLGWKEQTEIERAERRQEKNEDGDNN